VCGICGVVMPEGGGPPDLGLLRRMTGRLAHRGPDGSGIYRDRRAGLGHSRLAIVDTAGGAQPLSNEDGTLWITYNGEVYNYVELAADLTSRGHRLRTRSDTEVIVHAFEEWGDRCFERFNGQWALALWDSRTGRLVLSRDRLGVRPLYFAGHGGAVLFASEVKALFAHPGLPRSFDLSGLAQVFRFWCPVAPRTVFAGVEELPPGESAVVVGGRVERRAYWSLSFSPGAAGRHEDLAANAGELRRRLVEAARLRFLRSDVPVGAYLSGGIDSSVTAAIVAHCTPSPLTTFSLRFQEPEFDEGPYQELMTRRLGTDHRVVTVSASDIGRVFPEVVRAAETPLLRSAPAPLFLLSRLVRESGFKVVVTGEGADEVLAGYDLFREAAVRRFWAHDPQSTRRGTIVERLYPWMDRSPAAAPSFARAFFGRNLDSEDPALSHRPRWDSTATLMGILDPGVASRIAAAAVDEELLAHRPPEFSGWDPTRRAQWLEMKTLLAGYILSSQGDRMLMAHGVEGRFPFLDPGLVEFAGSVPARHLLLGLDEKHLLKRAFVDTVPEAILRRPKQPYRAPDAASFFVEPLPHWIPEVLDARALASAGVFSPRAVAGLVEKARQVHGERMSNTDNMRLVAVLSTMLLHRDFVVGDGGGEPGQPPSPTMVIDRVDGKQGESP
jgi:asparagine synthase (glutamine-hydrolysing)